MNKDMTNNIKLIKTDAYSSDFEHNLAQTLRMEQKRLRQRDFLVRGFLALGTLVSGIFVLNILAIGLSNSGFYDYLSVISSDFSLTTTYFKNITLAVLESIPVVPLVFFGVFSFWFASELRSLNRMINLSFVRGRRAYN